jgi:F0F1-type ATP synthase delta subunit
MAFESRKIVKALFKTLKKYPDQEEKVIDSFFDFVVQKKLESYLPNILKIIEAEFVKIEKKEKLRIISAETLNKKTINLITKKVGADNKVVIENEKDEEIIGGFVAYFEGLIYDGSILNQITKIKNNLQK